jgi:gliding-associated putative ABC transporter substrate-binding component GldG
MTRKRIHIRNLILLVLGLLLLNVLGLVFFKRFDLTKDKRYTLSEPSRDIILFLDSPIVIDVFLEGNFPSEFKRLRSETKQLLEEFQAVNHNIRFQFIDPMNNQEDPEAIRKQLIQFGLNPAQVEVRESGKIITEQVYPWALAYHDDKTVKIPLLKNQIGATSEERVNNSIQNLEYAFADGFNKLLHPKKRKVAVLKGNGEWDDRYIADFFSTLRDYYFIAPFTLDSVKAAPQRTLEQIREFDLIVIANPTEPFSEEEKYILDQYTMNGGASLWLIDGVSVKMDSISGNQFAYAKDLNLSDFFFKYGIRINPDLVKDLYAAPIVLSSGNDSNSQFSRYPWFFSPLSSSAGNHPIVTNLEAVKFDFASSIDTLPNSLEKTILLSTSPISKSVGMPFEINIDKEISSNLRIVNEGPPPEEYRSGEMPLAVLYEGAFNSVYSNRVKPLSLEAHKDTSEPTSMVVISDGDVIRNQLQNNRPIELGFDKWTSSFYGNKEFLLNTVNYLLDDSGLIDIRSKEIAVSFLDPQKTTEERTFWQVFNLLLPLGLLAIFGIAFNMIRKLRYSRYC